MEYKDLFSSEIESVKVFIFDSNDRLFCTKEATVSELINGNKMSLTDELEFGTYKVITVGSLSENFHVVDNQGMVPTRGVTTLQQFMFQLKRQSDNVDFEFPHLYFGGVVQVDFPRTIATHNVWQVSLIRETNNFSIQLESVTGCTVPDDAPYTFEIVTPEGAAYSWENEPIYPNSPVNYSACRLSTGKPHVTSMGYISTCRLFDRTNYEYRLNVRDIQTQDIVWDYDLMELLKMEHANESRRPDGTLLPLQEYLDRRGEWDMIIYYKGGCEGSDDAFLAIGININGWIIWFDDIEV